jgi:hypothetical protein
MLVSLAIVALLMGILLPALGRVREIARQTVCASNSRQVGLGLRMFADDNQGRLPMSQFLDPNSVAGGGGRSVAAQQRRMVLLRFPYVPHLGQGRSVGGQWDGIGKLFASEFLPASAVFYCPSHQGAHPHELYAPRFNQLGNSEIVSNYQYRGIGPEGQTRLDRLGSGVALVADALAGEEFFNHLRGFNVLVVDGSVRWFEDTGGQLAGELAETATATNDTLVGETWDRFDGLTVGGP